MFTRNGGNNLTNQSVQIGVGGSIHVEIPPADVVDRFVVDHERAVGVFQRRVSGQDGVVRFHHGGGDLRCRIDGKLQFGLLSIIDGEALHQEGSETRAGTTTERVEDEKSLKTSALIGILAKTIQDNVNNLLANGVMTASVVVRRIFFTCGKPGREKVFYL